jgi:amino acid permease
LDGDHHDNNSSTLSVLLGGLTGYHEDTDPATLGVNIYDIDLATPGVRYDADPATLGVNHNSSDFACEGGLQLFSTDPLKVIQAMPIFCFAFICHLNVLPVYQVLKRRTPKAMRRVFETAILFCCICYIFIGILGYARFCDRTPGNILAYETSPGSDTTRFSYFAADDYLITVARIAETLTCVLALPLIQYSTRMALHSFLVYTCRLCQSPKEAPQQKTEEGLKSPLLENDESPGKEADSEDSQHKCRTVAIRCAEALGLTVVEFSIAIAIPELSFVFGRMGATLATFLCFILPASFYLLATKHVVWPACVRSCCCCCKNDLDDAEETDTISPVDRASTEKQQCKRVLAVLQVLFGVVVGVLGTYVTIKSRFD